MRPRKFVRGRDEEWEGDEPQWCGSGAVEVTTAARRSEDEQGGRRSNEQGRRGFSLSKKTAGRRIQEAEGDRQGSMTPRGDRMGRCSVAGSGTAARTGK